MKQEWVGTLATIRGDGPSLSASATPTSILPPQDKAIIKANELAIGRMLRLSLWGRLSNIVTTPGTLTLDVRFGSVVVWNGAAMNLSTTAHTTLPWWLEVLLTCRAVGNSTNANMMALGRVISQCVSLTSAADGTATMPELLAPNIAPVVGTGFDSTVDNAVDVYATFSVNNAGNLIQVHGGVVEFLN